MGSALHALMHYISRMGPTHWVLIFCAVIVIGSMCLRGSGSRSNN